MQEQDKINANLHGHVLAKFNNYWKKAYKCENLARTLFNSCSKKNIDIYAISDDKYGNKNGISRFKQVLYDAYQLPKKELRTQKLDENLFIIYNNQNTLYCLNGQSTEVSDEKRTYEITTFGKSFNEKFNSFEEMKDYFVREGLISILEHPLANCHHGALSENELEKLISENLVDSIEFNSKIAVPNFFSSIPVLGGYTKARNEKAKQIADSLNFPVIANDDADTPLQIGLAYTIFPKQKIDFKNSKSITSSLNHLIRTKDFETHEDYEKFRHWFVYAIRAKRKGQ